MKFKIRSLVGDRAFYRGVLAVAIPIVIQNVITNFISMLDNIMVGQIGTEEMSGVAIVNQLISVYFLCIFGAVSGAGLFASQFFGKGDHDGVRHTFRFKIYISAILLAAALALFLLRGDSLITLYLHEGSETGDLEKTLHFAKEYLSVSLWGLLPYTVTQIYSGTLREIRHTMPPMVAGITGISVNLIFNYFLIFGTCGFPKLGVAGAAIATVISRYVECAIVILWAHCNPKKCLFVKGLYRSFRIPAPLMKQIFLTGVPLIINETLWSAGQAALLQSYSSRGIAVVSAMNISNTLSNIFAVLYLSMGTSISILLGHLLGAGKDAEAYDSARKMMALSCTVGVIAGGLIALCAPFFPLIYNTTEEVRSLATSFTILAGLSAPITAIVNASYFTLRSGGKTVITFLFDSVYVWVVSVTLAFCLTTFTALPIVAVVAICYFVDAGKATLGIVLTAKGIWLRNITT